MAGSIHALDIMCGSGPGMRLRRFVHRDAAMPEAEDHRVGAVVKGYGAEAEY